MNPARLQFILDDREEDKRTFSTDNATNIISEIVTEVMNGCQNNSNVFATIS